MCTARPAGWAGATCPQASGARSTGILASGLRTPAQCAGDCRTSDGRSGAPLPRRLPHRPCSSDWRQRVSSPGVPARPRSGAHSTAPSCHGGPPLVRGRGPAARAAPAAGGSARGPRRTSSGPPCPAGRSVAAARRLPRPDAQRQPTAAVHAAAGHRPRAWPPAPPHACGLPTGTGRAEAWPRLPPECSPASARRETAGPCPLQGCGVHRARGH
mmetsp:Transcript_16934/g.49338  ORF Transcript_16934/g.49338 Transcript_16934/m.49338 type:complete len:214 (+) Transcript_16934:813-1454(+)